MTRIVALLTMAGAPAKADAIDGALKSVRLWGGPFAPDCSRPAGPRNPHATFAGDGARVALSLDFGSNAAPQVYVIEDAHRQLDGSLSLRAEAESDHAVHDVVYMVGENPDSFRAMSIRIRAGAAAATAVDRGAFVKSGADTPRYVRCAP